MSTIVKVRFNLEDESFFDLFFYNAPFLSKN